MYRLSLLLVMFIIAALTTGCAQQIPTLFSSMQADGWSAQPVAIQTRFTPSASLDPASGWLVGDEGYSLYVLTSANYWNFKDSPSFVRSFMKHPRGHTWLILDGPAGRLECGHSGNSGLTQPRYHEGVIQRLRDGDPNPIAYIWETMDDGQFELGNPGYDPTFVWRMPITREAYGRIYEYILHREYSQFSLSTYNCGEMVTHAAALAGVNLISMIRLTFPSQGNIHGYSLLVWTDPKYRVFDIRSMDVLEVDLRQLVRLGIGADATAGYLALRPYPPVVRLDHPRDLYPIAPSDASDAKAVAASEFPKRKE